MARRKWVKLWCHETLYGSTPRELTLTEVGVWHYCLALAGDSPVEGVICATETVGFSTKQLSQMMNCKPKIAQKVLERLVEVGKLEHLSNGFRVVNWHKYQSEYSRTKLYYEAKAGANQRRKPTPESTEEGVENLHAKNKKENKKKEVEEEGTGGSNIFSLYEQSIGMLAPIMVEELKLAEQTYSFNWIEDAFKEAIRLNKRNWKYINAILERWGREGRDVGKQKQKTKAESDPEEYFKRYAHLRKGRGDGKQLK